MDPDLLPAALVAIMIGFVALFVMPRTASAQRPGVTVFYRTFGVVVVLLGAAGLLVFLLS